MLSAGSNYSPDTTRKIWQCMLMPRQLSAEYPELPGGQPDWSLLQGLPWERLQFLPMNYGKDGHR